MVDSNIDPLCKQAELFYYDILCVEGDQAAPASIVEHVDSCQNCREQLKRLEAAMSQPYSADSGQGGSESVSIAMLKLHLVHASRVVTCETIKPFLPTLLHPALRVAVPTPITAHLDNCEACSEDFKTVRRMELSPDQLIRLSELLANEDAVSSSEVQALGLSDAVSRIIEREESGVATIYSIAEHSETEAPSASDDLYAGFPVRVEVADSRDRAATAAFGARKTRLRAGFGPFAKIAAAAAVLLIVAALFFSGPSAKATTLAEIYEALENVRNVYIAHFISGKKEPVQEQWVSRSLGFHLIKKESRIGLRDIRSGQMMERRSGEDSVEIKPISPEMLSDAEKIMRGSLGLLPFEELSMFPRGSTWSPVVDEKLVTAPESLDEVYDLSWVQENPNGIVMMKWRFFVDAKTRLPRKVELYRRSADDAKYELKSVRVADYLSETRIQEVVNEEFPAGDVSLGQPERMPVLVSVPVLNDQ